MVENVWFYAPKLTIAFSETLSGSIRAESTLFSALKSLTIESRHLLDYCGWQNNNSIVYGLSMLCGPEDIEGNWFVHPNTTLPNYIIFISLGCTLSTEISVKSLENRAHHVDNAIRDWFQSACRQITDSLPFSHRNTLPTSMWDTISALRALNWIMCDAQTRSKSSWSLKTLSSHQNEWWLRQPEIAEKSTKSQISNTVCAAVHSQLLCTTRFQH